MFVNLPEAVKNVNELQKQAKTRLEQELGLGLAVFGEIDRYAFMDVEGVTVVVGTEGGYDIPAIRSYDDAFTAASNAPRLWNQQKRRDDADPSKARGWKTGHLSPQVSMDWRCPNRDCACVSEDTTTRMNRSLNKKR